MTEPMSYIATADCGCIVMAMVDVPEHRKEIAKEISKCVREGLTIQRVSTQYVRDNLKRCTHAALKGEAA